MLRRFLPCLPWNCTSTNSVCSSFSPLSTTPSPNIAWLTRSPGLYCCSLGCAGVREDGSVRGGRVGRFSPPLLRVGGMVALWEESMGASSTAGCQVCLNHRHGRSPGGYTGPGCNLLPSLCAVQESNAGHLPAWLSHNRGWKSDPGEYPPGSAMAPLPEPRQRKSAGRLARDRACAWHG